MTVYTRLDKQEIENFLQPYGLGPLLDYREVTEGIENTNYFVTVGSNSPLDHTDNITKNVVLTIFESQQHSDLPFFVELTTLLHQQGSPVPCPLRDRRGTAIQTLKGKPALLVPRLAGSHPEQPSIAQCQAIGAELARIHLHTQASKLHHESNRSLSWLKRTAEAINPQLSPEDQQLLQELDRFQGLCSALPHPLPQAIIHSDLFRDNALFTGDQLTGVIDFNSAGTGYLLFDLAVVVNDWASLPDGAINPAKASAIVEAYRTIRPLSPDEIRRWNDFLRVAATRFWISRLAAQLQLADSRCPTDLTSAKNPQVYKNILLGHIKHPHILPHV